MEDFTSEKQDREARIKARRTRIEQRKRAKDDEGKTIGGSHDDGPGQSEGAKQTQQSLAHIDRVKAQKLDCPSCPLHVSFECKRERLVYRAVRFVRLDRLRRKF